MTVHVVIPDCQVGPGHRINFLNAAGNYIAHIQPDVIVCLGDFADMHSLSTYDTGKLAGEGARYARDIIAAKRGMEVFLEPIGRLNNKLRKSKKSLYTPRMVLTLGNHENRINRHVNAYPVLQGQLSVDNLGYSNKGWEVISFLDTCEVDGILYSHYFPRNASGNIVQTYRGAPNARTQVQREGQSCTAGHLQGLDFHIQQRRTRRDYGIIAGSCLAPHHRVLTENLEYIPLGDLKVGEKLVSFEEFPGPRKARRYKTGTVQNIKLDVDDLYLVSLSNAEVFTVTADHLWLVRGGSGYHWIRTDQMVTNHRFKTRITRLFDDWDQDFSYEAGYLSGIFDGEGSLYNRKDSAFSLRFAQRDNEVLAKAVLFLELLGIKHVVNNYRQGTNGNVIDVTISGTSANKAKFLGIIRPDRLLAKVRASNFGRITQLNKEPIFVDCIQPIGKGEIVRVDVDAKTMIVDGYPHHNCYESDFDFLCPQGTAYWRGIIVKHEVNDGMYDAMFVSLNYLLGNHWDGTERYAT